MKKKLLGVSYILFLITFLFTLNPVRLNAETSSNQLSLNDITLYQGNSGYINLYMDNASIIGGLSFEVYFDSDYITINNWYADSLIDGETISVNNDVPGKLSISIISNDGIQLSGNIFHFYVGTAYDIPLGDYSLDLAVLDAYDVDLNPITFSSTDSKVTIQERLTEAQRIYLYTSLSENELYQDDVFSYTIYSWNLAGLAAGNFEIYYDKNVIELNSVEIKSSLTDLGAIITINDQIPGYIDISFASIDGINYAGDMFEIQFSVLANQLQQSEINLEAKHLYDENLNPLIASNVDILVPLFEREIIEDYPNIYIADYAGEYNQEFTVEVVIESLSGLAAGDFEIDFDTSILSVVNIAIGEEVTSNGGYLEYSPIYDDGIINFSYINENGLIAEETLLYITFQPNNIEDITESEILINGSGVVDASFNPLQLDYISANVLLTNVTTVRFIDFDDSIIEESNIYQGKTIVFPDAPQRGGTTFISWNKVTDKDGLIVYQAIYSLNLDCITFDDLTTTYNGLDQDILVSGIIPGVTVVYTNNSQCEVGTYNVEADIYLDDVNQYNLSASFTISPLEIELILDDNIISYGETIDTTYTTNLEVVNQDLNVQFFSKDGTGVGEHILSAEAENSNYTITVTDAVLTINKAEITITANDSTSVYGEALNSLTYTVDGTIYNDEVTVYLEKSPGLTVGTYDITVTASNTNYDITLVNGTYTITKATYDMSDIGFDNLIVSYDGTSHSIEITGTLPQDVTVSYMNNSQSDLGVFTVTATFSGDANNYNEISDMTATLTIEKNTISGVEFEDASYDYNGQSHMLSASGIPSGAQVVYDTEGYIDAGTYSIEATISQYGYNDLILTSTMTINQAEVTITADDLTSAYGEPLDSLTYTLEGTIYGTDDLNVVLEKESGLNSGEYEITVTASNANYDITLVNATYIINGFDVDMSQISFSDESVVYDGQGHTLLINGVLPVGIANVTYVNNTLTQVGQTVAVIRFEVDANYNPVDNMLATLTITKADITGVELIGGTFEYDGTAKTAQVSTDETQYGDSFDIEEITDLSYINAGEYDVSIKLISDNYNSLVLNSVLTIEKADILISESDFTITIAEEDITISYGDLDNYIYVSLNDSNYVNENNITELQENNDYTIDIYIAESDNYNMSNIITIIVTTYLSWTTFENLAPDTANSLVSRDIIVDLIQMKEKLNPTEKSNAQVIIDSLISDYNSLITKIHDEYKPAEEVLSYLQPNYVSLTLLLFGLAVEEELRWKR